jgi:hypothetical protein
VWNGRKATLLVFTDLKKALDMVDHRILLEKLEHYGVRGVVLGFLVSYLRGKFQHVVSRVGGWLSVGCHRGQFYGPCFSILMSMTWLGQGGSLVLSCLQMIKKIVAEG